VLLLAVVFAVKVPCPKAILLAPVVLVPKLLRPIAKLFEPVVFSSNAT